MSKDYKIIVLDLDGTLTNSKKEISQRNKLALIEAQKTGKVVVLASGRPTYGIVPLAEDLQLNHFGGYLLSYNGGQIINYKTQESLYHTLLPLEVIPKLYHTVSEFQATLLSYDNEFIITENASDRYVSIEAHLNNMQIKEVPSFINALTKPVTKCLAVGDPEILIQLEYKIKELYGDFINCYRSEPFFLELVPHNIDKAYALSKLIKHLEINRKEMIAFGDGLNDLTMIEYAGMGVAMANAQEAVKEIADYITLSNDEDGVAHILEQLNFSLN